MIRYIAKRGFALGHVANEVYEVDIEISDAVPEVRDIKTDERSAGGAMETCFERQDYYWTITTAPVRGRQLELLREFMDSIVSGETFSVWLRDKDVEPLVLKLEGADVSEMPFMRLGGPDEDYFIGRFTALQAAPYSIGGLEAGGFDGGGSVPIDIYDPEEGGSGGGLDEPEVTGVLLTAGAVGTRTGYSDGTTVTAMGDISGPLAWDGNEMLIRELFFDSSLAGGYSALYIVFELANAPTTDWFDLMVGDELCRFVRAADVSTGVYAAYAYISSALVDEVIYLISYPEQASVPLSTFTFQITCGVSGSARGFSGSYGTLNSNGGSSQVRIAAMNTNSTPNPDRIILQMYSYNGPINPPNFASDLFTSITVEGIGTFNRADAVSFSQGLGTTGSKMWSATWQWNTTTLFPTSGSRNVTVNV